MVARQERRSWGWIDTGAGLCLGTRMCKDGESGRGLAMRWDVGSLLLHVVRQKNGTARVFNMGSDLGASCQCPGGAFFFLFSKILGSVLQPYEVVPINVVAPFPLMSLC